MFWGSLFWPPSLTSRISTVRPFPLFLIISPTTQFLSMLFSKVLHFLLYTSLPLDSCPYLSVCLQYYCLSSSFFQHNPSFSTSLHLFSCFHVSSHLQPHQVSSSNHVGLSFWGINWTICHLVLQIFSGGSNSYINLLLFNFSHFAPFCLFNLNSACLPCWGYPGALLSKVWAKVNLHQNPPGFLLKR